MTNRNRQRLTIAETTKRHLDNIYGNLACRRGRPPPWPLCVLEPIPSLLTATRIIDDYTLWSVAFSTCSRAISSTCPGKANASAAIR